MNEIYKRLIVVFSQGCFTFDLDYDLDSTLWTKLSVCGYSFTEKVYFILNNWFLTILNEMQLASGTCKTFSCILTVDLDL